MTDPVSGIVDSVYNGLLDRSPNQTELRHWSDVALQHGFPLMYQLISESSEAKDKDATKKAERSRYLKRFESARSDIKAMDRFLHDLVACFAGVPLQLGFFGVQDEDLPKTAVDRLVNAPWIETKFFDEVTTANGVDLALLGPRGTTKFIAAVSRPLPLPRVVFLLDNQDNNLARASELSFRTTADERLEKLAQTLFERAAPEFRVAPWIESIAYGGSTRNFYPAIVAHSKNAGTPARPTAEKATEMLAMIATHHFLLAAPNKVCAALDGWDRLTGSDLARRYLAIAGLAQN
jgi:hypothetical protein